MHHKYTKLDRLTSITMTNFELESYYYEKLNDVIRNKNASNKFDIEHMQNNLDCTIHVEVHRGERVSRQFVLRI